MDSEKPVVLNAPFHGNSTELHLGKEPVATFYIKDAAKMFLSQESAQKHSE